MFKFNKGTHLTILATFAIVFIVIYLYFTITDLRKLQGEVTRLRTKVAALEQSSCPVQEASAEAVSPAAAPVPVPSVVPVPVVAAQEETESVLTEDIKKLLDDEEDEEDVEQTPPPPPSQEPEGTEHVAEAVEQPPAPADVVIESEQEKPKPRSASRKAKGTK